MALEVQQSVEDSHNVMSVNLLIAVGVGQLTVVVMDWWVVVEKT